VMESLGRLFLILGVVFLILGAAILLSGKIPFIGKLPGDIVIKKENYTLYFPLATSLLLSLLVSFIFFIVFRIKK